MIDIIILLLALITGFFVKLVDLIEDDKLRVFSYANIFFGLVYGVLIGYVISNSDVVATIWIGAVLGNMFFGKIDAYGHYAGAFAIVVYVLLFGTPQLNILLTVIFTTAAIGDELVIHLVKKNKKRSLRLLQLRPVLEITAIVASIITGQWMIWFAILSFDIAYNLTAMIKKSR